ncbi:MAG: peptide chain release factor N(5)-glutamine methyltransferase [Planctomycetes bacterium]|nr:peptide chain release factor N(5)-glutamine methyltransferase [Planctomycetota bacterium]
MTDGSLAVLEVLRRTELYFRRAGIPSPRLDAEVLLAHVLGVARIGLYAGFDRPLLATELAAYRALVRRRADREPVAYLLEMKEFHSLEFRVGPAVLIPRPETEHLVDAAVERARPLASPRLLDLGTGSGAIAVSFARDLPGALFLASDLSPEALAVARGNAERMGVADRGDFRAGDLYDAVRGLGPFDVVVCNPPYVAPGETVDPECRREPVMALFTEGDPIDIYRRVANGAPELLVPGGWLLLELPGSRADEVRGVLPPALEVESVIPDFHGLPRVLVARLAW